MDRTSQGVEPRFSQVTRGQGRHTSAMQQKRDKKSKSQEPKTHSNSTSMSIKRSATQVERIWRIKRCRKQRSRGLDGKK